MSGSECWYTISVKSFEIRKKFLEFYKARGHIEIPSASLVPINDPTTLFTSSGMQPMIPYLLGQPHSLGKRLTDSQKSFRTVDIEEVGDNRHTTFFEMLGNWSLGDYFKKEQLGWIYEFLIKDLRLNPEKFYVTVFNGYKDIPKDDEAAEIWKSLGVKDDHIFYYDVEKNWWSRVGTPEQMPIGEPGGPDSEMFYEFTKVKHDPKFGKTCHPNCDCGRFMEIGNNVFMTYRKISKNKFELLKQKNIDFGGGLERILAASNDESDIFRSDLFWPLIQEIEKITGKSYENNENRPPMQIIADHIKAATFLIEEGVKPSNKTQGYVLRRLLRRAMIKLRLLGGRGRELAETSKRVIDIYKGVYLDRDGDRDRVAEEIQEEVERFSKSLDRGLKMLDKMESASGKAVFDLYQSYGFPIEITEELLAERGQKIDKNEFEEEFEKHRELSRTAAKGMFKGGLADKSEEVTKLHTVTHLLHAALRKYLGEDVHQVGSNITGERARFDFTYPSKLTEDQKRKVEGWINEQIKLDLPIKMEVETLAKAKKEGALAFFGAKYGEKVNVYSIGNQKTGIVSKEVCGGPHAASTSEISGVRLGKEEGAGTGRRRVYVNIN